MKNDTTKLIRSLTHALAQKRVNSKSWLEINDYLNKVWLFEIERKENK